MLLLQVRVDLGVMAMKRYSAFPKALASPSDCLVSYPEYLLGDMQSVYSTASADWAIRA